ncbi:chorismate lyase [Vibrio anguillarum]|uniref:chorismate lyase n=1 Tax=Vibrio anguillarum TaxID=55601 RepID=UPI0018FE2121|nr:chorismate lyase [Vibrio anguillarum]MBF4424385.1 chorismate lyase [Vibrio anguillarum]
MNTSMNQSISLYLSALREVIWQQPDVFSFPDQVSQSWLLEQGSLSRMLEAQCQQLSVELLHNKLVEAEKLQGDEMALLSDEACLLRQVVLRGDQQPWVLGRTLIPQSSMLGQQYDLARQGDIPLGLTVFRAEHVKRDALQVGWAMMEEGPLLARRSRLWMNNKPMLVAELFLPFSPIYSKERVS